VDICSFFEVSSKHKSHSSATPSQEYLYQLRQQTKKEVTQELTQSLMQEFDKLLETLGLLQKPPSTVQHDLHLVIKINTKESYAVTDALRDGVGSTIQHGLYTDCYSSP